MDCSISSQSEDSTKNFESCANSFRFPTPAADHNVTTWLEGSTHANMEPSSDDSSLVGSAYEFVDTDDESRDGNATESVASVDFGYADDFASLADTEQSDESVEEEVVEESATEESASEESAEEENGAHTFPEMLTTIDRTPHGIQDPEKISFCDCDRVAMNEMRSAAEWRALVPVVLTLLSVLGAILTGVPAYLRGSSTPTISVNSKYMSAYPTSTTRYGAVHSVTSVLTTSTTTVVKTSTRTITVAEATSSNSLAIVPLKELAKFVYALNDKSIVNKTSICSAEILTENEILIRIPSTTKLSWLAKEAMSVNITRDNATVETQRAYSSDEGIILSLAKEDAYGVLNISIITSRKPKVNETFQVDFGTPASRFWQSITSFVKEELSFLETKPWNDSQAIVEQVVREAAEHCQSAMTHLELLRRCSAHQAMHASRLITDFAKNFTLEAAKGGGVLSKEVGLWLVEAESTLSKEVAYLKSLKQPWNSHILKAQIQSKLLWLKIQGKYTEYSEYKRRASDATRSQTDRPEKSQGPDQKSGGRARKRVGRMAGCQTQQGRRKVFV